MPTLDEYLGGIFQSLTQARIMADIQTVDAAEKYARHDLLKHFSVPRLRFSDIELTIPVAIDKTVAKKGGTIEPDGADGLRQRLLQALQKRLGLRTIPQSALAVLNPIIHSRITDLAETKADAPLDKTLSEFSSILANDIGELVRGATIRFSSDNAFDDKAVAEAFFALASDTVRAIKPAGGVGSLHVIVESHRLREQRPTDLIMIKMSVSEEGMELHQIEMSDGKTERKLLPE